MCNACTLRAALNIKHIVLNKIVASFTSGNLRDFKIHFESNSKCIFFSVDSSCLDKEEEYLFVLCNASLNTTEAESSFFFNQFPQRSEVSSAFTEKTSFVP